MCVNSKKYVFAVLSFVSSSGCSVSNFICFVWAFVVLVNPFCCIVFVASSVCCFATTLFSLFSVPSRFLYIHIVSCSYLLSYFLNSSAPRSPPGRHLKPQTQSPEPWAKTPSCLTACWWSDTMKYRASLSPMFSDSLPRGFRASRTPPKFSVVRKCGINTGRHSRQLFLTLCHVGSMSRGLLL